MPAKLKPYERRWFAIVKKQRCVICELLGWPQEGPTEAHHVREGAGLSQRSSHFMVAALCRYHHSGAGGIHHLGTRGFYTRYKVDELDCVARTVELVRLVLVQVAPPLVDLKTPLHPVPA